MRSFSLVALLALAVAQPSFAQSVTSVRDGSHDFDFALGNWTTEVTIIKDPFNKPNEQTHMRGTKAARPIWNGEGGIEEIGAEGANSHWPGATTFPHHTAAHQWSQNFVHSSEGRMEPPSTGGHPDG